MGRLSCILLLFVLTALGCAAYNSDNRRFDDAIDPRLRKVLARISRKHSQDKHSPNLAGTERDQATKEELEKELMHVRSSKQWQERGGRSGQAGFLADGRSSHEQSRASKGHRPLARKHVETEREANADHHTWARREKHGARFLKLGR